MRPMRTKNLKLTKYFVKTGNPRYLGTKQNTNLFTDVNKCGRWKFYSFETEIEAQACNVSYLCTYCLSTLTITILPIQYSTVKYIIKFLKVMYTVLTVQFIFFNQEYFVRHIHLWTFLGVFFLGYSTVTTICTGQDT